jgi:peptide deformylase
VTVDLNIQNVASAMADLMTAENGIGLSANQVGLPFRMFVIKWQEEALCLVNPAVRAYGKTKEVAEGCLSLPDVVAKVKRRDKCRVTAWDLNGDDIDEEISGDLARVVQHEMDHLNGVLFIDRLTDLQRTAAPLRTHLTAAQAAWAKYPKEFDQETFNELANDYCSITVSNRD